MEERVVPERREARAPVAGSAHEVERVLLVEAAAAKQRLRAARKRRLAFVALGLAVDHRARKEAIRDGLPAEAVAVATKAHGAALGRLQHPARQLFPLAARKEGAAGAAMREERA